MCCSDQGHSDPHHRSPEKCLCSRGSPLATSRWTNRVCSTERPEIHSRPEKSISNQPTWTCSLPGLQKPLNRDPLCSNEQSEGDRPHPYPGRQGSPQAEDNSGWQQRRNPTHSTKPGAPRMRCDVASSREAGPILGNPSVASAQREFDRGNNRKPEHRLCPPDTTCDFNQCVSSAVYLTASSDQPQLRQEFLTVVGQMVLHPGCLQGHQSEPIPA